MGVRVLAWVMMALLLQHGCSLAVLQWHYALNPGYYAQLCENQDKPEMRCAGHCQLDKEASLLTRQPTEAADRGPILLFSPFTLPPGRALPAPAEAVAPAADFCSFTFSGSDYAPALLRPPRG